MDLPKKEKKKSGFTHCGLLGEGDCLLGLLFFVFWGLWFVCFLLLGCFCLFAFCFLSFKWIVSLLPAHVSYSQEGEECDPHKATLSPKNYLA